MNIALEMSCAGGGYSIGFSGGKAAFNVSRHDGEADGVSDDGKRRYAHEPDGREPEQFGPERLGYGQW
jgi:hypothetical protein